MNTRDLVVICITLILLMSIGLFVAFSSNDTQATILTMTSSPILNEGGNLTLKLNDDEGSAIADQRIEINLTHADNGIIENFTLKTNETVNASWKIFLQETIPLSQSIMETRITRNPA